MRKNICSLIFLLCQVTIGFAQQPVILADESLIDITKDIDVFHDRSNSLTIKDITSDRFLSLFSRNNRSVIHIPQGESTKWLRFVVKNNSSRQKTYYVELRNAGIRNIQFFTSQNSILISGQTQGADLPFHKRQLQSRFFTHQLILDSFEEITCFVRVQNSGQAVHIPVVLYNESSFLQRTSSDNISTGIYYGILITFLLSVLALMIMGINKRILLLFLLYILFTIIFLVNLDGFGFQYIYPNYVWLNKNINIVVPYLIYFAFIQFTLLIFKDLCKDRRRACSLLIVLSVIGILLFFMQIVLNFEYNIGVAINAVYALFSASVISINVLKSMKRIPAIGRLFLPALFLHLAVIAMLIISTYSERFGFNQFEFTIKVFTLTHFSLILAAIVRQIGLYHFEIEEASHKNLKNLSALKEKTNLELENTVRERTKSLQEANRKLNSLIRHNNQIADELHKQREEIERKNNELERAFKKSSAQHIRIQKAMMLNVEQQNKLSASIELIQEKNIKLEQQNEEILSQQDKIREQNSLLEERNRNITDSILYAERIQNSFFPPESKVKEAFPESFIYFRPKDILSGDIYWVDTLYKEGKELKTIAAIDCTGHGIPGALMSIMARDAINEAIHHKNLTDPGQIIDCLNDIIINSLNKRGNINHVKDGMDMSMIVVDYEHNLLYFAGAKNPLYLVSEGTLHIQKGYIHSVGTLPNENERISFPTHTFEFHMGDVIYLFSDGFADQFGGKNGNKFRYARFNDLLMEICNLQPLEQYFKLDQAFNEWKGNYEQVDDVLIIGIKL